MKKNLLLIIMLFGTMMALAQNSTVTGVVYFKDDGKPLLGAVVQIEGTNLGTSTDESGKFTLANVPASATHVSFTLIGMKPLVLPIKTEMEIYMESDIESLGEIVVTAFGQQTKASFTGSATTVKKETIEKRQVTNVMDALTGQVAGVQILKPSGNPDATPTIYIRGLSSINSRNDPLIVVDGVPYDGGWNSINPNDVETMTVLKDAASNALYGARGANGVIMITTKSARSGQATITFDARVGVNTRARNMYEYIKDPGHYYELQYLALNNYYKAQGQSEHTAYMNANNALYGPTNAGGLGYIVYDVPNGESLIGSNGKLNPNATLGRKYYTTGGPGDEGYLLMPDDWLEEAFRTSVRQEYNISANGGNDRGQFYGSFGYLNHEGIVYSSDFERYTGRLNASYKLKDWATAGGNAAYTHYTTNGVGDDSGTSLFGHIGGVAPIYPLYVRKADGSFYEDSNGKIYDFGTGQYEGLERPVLPNTNPLRTNTIDTQNTIGNTIAVQGFMDITFLKDFKFTYNISATNRDYRMTYAYNPWYGYNASNKGNLYKYHYRIFSVNSQQILNYNKQIENHHISAMVGHETYNYTYDYLMGNRKNMYSFFGNQELAGAITLADANSTQRKYNTEGFFSRVMYDYDQKYFMSASYRRDGSSRFHPDHRWGNFWSVGGGWLIQREDWFNVKWIDMLKFKASYGSQGNDNISASNYWYYTDQYSIEDNDGEVSLVLYSKGNKNITWETNRNFNTGFEFELFNRRLIGSVEYFYRKTIDMLTYFTTPISIGYSGYYANVGDMVNKGVELDLTGVILSTRDFNWSVNINLTHYKNKVTYLASERKGSEVDGYYGYQSGSYFIAEGKPRYEWHQKKFAGINEVGLPTWYQKTGDTEIITDNYSNASYYLSGTPFPDVYGGFGTSLSWKGIDFSASFSYQIGGLAYDSGYASGMSAPQSNNAGYNFHVDVLKSWTPENPSSDIARWHYGDNNNAASSTRWLTKASYLSLNNLTLGYTLPKNLTEKVNISKFRLSLTCDNVFFVSKRKGLDPRYSIDGSTSTSTYTPIRTISIGANVQF